MIVWSLFSVHSVYSGVGKIFPFLLLSQRFLSLKTIRLGSGNGNIWRLFFSEWCLIIIKFI